MILHYANAWVRLERVDPDSGGVMIHRVEPVFRALPETELTLLELQDKRHSGHVGCFIAGDHLVEKRLLPCRRSEIPYGRLA